MKNSPLLISLGEPNSIFSEILFKTFKKKNIKKINRPILIIGSINLLKSQMESLKYSFKIKEINFVKNKKLNLNKNCINIINVEYNFKKTFDKISYNSNLYISKCFKIAIELLKSKSAFALINGPISKTHFLKKKYLGITEYLAHKTRTKNFAMLIYNKDLSVCPLTTHLPIKQVSKNINKDMIKKKIKLIDNFFKKYLNQTPHIAITGLNPHCESTNVFDEDEKIIKPAIKSLAKLNYRIFGPFAADTIFLKENRKKYRVVVGMYHDQVLTPIKTLFEYDAINITLGLPFIRVSPDHGPNELMMGKNKSNPLSLIKALTFLDSKK